jgi:hypothetical protein
MLRLLLLPQISQGIVWSSQVGSSSPTVPSNRTAFQNLCGILFIYHLEVVIGLIIVQLWMVIAKLLWQTPFSRLSIWWIVSKDDVEIVCQVVSFWNRLSFETWWKCCADVTTMNRLQMSEGGFWRLILVRKTQSDDVEKELYIPDRESA